MKPAILRPPRGAFVLAVFVLLGLAILCGAGFFLFVSWKLPSVASLKDFHPSVATEVFSDEYLKIGEFYYPERRIHVDLHRTPPLLVKAFIAAEDSEFFRHRGISFLGIFRAFVKNMLAGQVRQGGSTITQQVAKALLLSPERTLVRKAREVLLALKMEKYLTKEEILELYVNQVYLGNGAYGVQAAAQAYFGKDVAGLSPGQIALLAGMTKAPSRDNPLTDANRGLARRNYVLKRMLEEGYLTKEETEAAINEPLAVSREKDFNLRYAPYFVEYVRKYVTERYGEARVHREGLRVYTTVRASDSLAARKAVRTGLEEMDRRQGWRGPVRHLEENGRAAFVAKLMDEQAAEPKDPDQNLKALVYDVRDKEGKAYLNLGFAKATLPIGEMGWARKPNPDRFWENDLITRPSQALRSGDVVLVRLVSEDRKGKIVRLVQEPDVQGALVSMDPRNGAIRAMVGGYDYEKSELNRAVQSRRQPGSSFKPVIYAAALDNGYTPASIIVDSPVVYDDPTHEFSWRPKNFEGDFQGNTVFRDCLIRSRNVPTIKLVQQLGVDTVINYAHRIGIASDLSRDFSLALGSSSVVPLELLTVYAQFAAGGRRLKPVAIKAILDRDGHVLERNLPEDPGLGPLEQSALLDSQLERKSVEAEAVKLGADPKARLPEEYAVSPQTAYILTHLLKEVVRSGTGTRARALNRPVAGKTGTTNDNFDVWFFGYTPDLAAGVWMGFDKPSSLGVREQGGHAATPVWLEYMQEALKDRPVLDFPVPDGVAFAQLDPTTGKLATSKTKSGILEAFREGTEPGETTDEADRKKNSQNFFMNE